MPALAPEAPVANRNARAMVANAPTVAALSVALRILSPVPRRSDGAHDRAEFFFNSFRWRKRQAPRWSPATPRPSTPPAAREHARDGPPAQPDFAIFPWRVGDESTSSAKHRERQSLSKTKLKTLPGNLPPPPPARPPADRIRQISCNVWQRRETGGRRLAVERSLPATGGGRRPQHTVERREAS